MASKHASSHAAHCESGHDSWGRVRDDGIAIQQAAHVRRPRPTAGLRTGNERSTTLNYSPVSARAAPPLPTRVRVSGVHIAASSRGISHQQPRYPHIPFATSIPEPFQTGCQRLLSRPPEFESRFTCHAGFQCRTFGIHHAVADLPDELPSRRIRWSTRSRRRTECLPY